MLTYNISERGNTPIYEYIYKCIRDDIMAGRLEAGSKLPSKRELAVNNGIALITVENAYAQLIIEGYVDARPRRGYFVQNVAEVKGNRKVLSDTSAVADETEVIDAVEITDKTGQDLVSKPVGQNDSFPYATWSKLMRRVLNDREADFGMAPPSEGMYELRLAIASYLRNAKNLDVDPDCIVVGPGTEYLHSIVLQLIGRSRLVAVEDPGYRKAAQIYESNGMKVIHIPVDKDGIEVDRLEGSGVRLVHCSPAHHFPTGIVMSAKRRHKLLKWAENQQAYIIEDDYDSEFRFKGLPLPTLMSLENEHVIYMNTFTGTLAPSIRVAYMVLPDSLMDIYRQKLRFLSGTVSSFDQLTLAAFIAEGYYERHISRMRNRYRKIRERYRCVFEKSNISNVASIVEDPAGLNMIFSVDKDGEIVSEKIKKSKYITAMNEYCYYHSQIYNNKYIVRYMDVDDEWLLELFNEMV